MYIFQKIKIFIFLILFFSFTSITFVKADSVSFYATGGGSINVGQTITSTISVNGDTSYNAVSVNVSYKNLSFISASASSNWTPISGPSNSNGNISFSGAVLGNSYTGSKNVITITFRIPSSPSTSTISASGQIALTNENGRQINGSGNTVTYTSHLAPTPLPTPTPTPLPKPVPGQVQVSSTSHPSKDNWYKINNVDLSWNLQAGVTDFSYILDQKSDTVPDDTSEGNVTSKSYTNVIDGINYFHIKAKNDVGWGSVTHYQINIDTIAPDPFTITKVNTDNNSYLLYFSTNDLTSGILKYTVNTDNVDRGEQKSPFKVDKSVTNVVITAYDKALNSTESKINTKDSSVLVNTQSAPSVVNTKNNNTGTGILLAISIIVIIYSSILTYIFWKKNFAKKKL